MSLFFPQEPRTFPGRRTLKIILRAAHVLCAAGLFGAYLFDRPDSYWLAATIVSGVALLVLDLHESGAFLLEVRGLVVGVKLALFCALPYWTPYEAHVLGFLILGSVVSSHAPGRFRHRLLFGRGRVRTAETQG